ncbi:hypothetical protein CBR_g40234 [Chara braunii]|uniref:Uncharacterized protein n=1 Tax=Chara braunii TaxID=69332 RepID=A0A388K1R0_CHABU|nr:hypothetical protein CBR_g40234 [Chara braunii]|eukprot:GBG63990.1 hypothetical protein CBR_g40234 [Chara braunii]
MGGEAKQWVLAEANAVGFEDIGEWAKTLTLKQFLPKIKDRFLDKTTTDKAFDQLTSIGQKHWTSVEALSHEVDRLLQVPGLNLRDSQVLYMYSRALPEPIRGHLVAEAKSGKYNYRQFCDLALQREQMTSQVKNSYAVVVKSGGGGGGRPYNGKRILWRQKCQDHTLVVFDDDTVEKRPLKDKDNNSDSEKGEVTAVVANKGGPPRSGTGKKPRPFPWHPGIADGKPWLKSDGAMRQLADQQLRHKRWAYQNNDTKLTIRKDGQQIEDRGILTEEKEMKSRGKMVQESSNGQSQLTLTEEDKEKESRGRDTGGIAWRKADYGQGIPKNWHSEPGRDLYETRQ